MAFLKHSVLALRILFWVLLAALGVFVLATAAGLALERDRALTAAHAEASAAAANNQASLGLALWNYDSAVLSALLQGMVKVDSIARVEVLDRDKTVAAASAVPEKAGSDRVWSVPVRAPDGSTVIGTLRVTESYAGIQQRIDAMARTLAATELFKIVGLAFILFVIVYRKVARHLSGLADAVVALEPANLAARVALERRKFNAYRDELDILAEAINRFLGERAEEMAKRATAEDSLRDHLAEIEATLGALSDGVIALDAACRIKYANGAALALLRVPDAARGATGLEDWLEVIDTRSEHPMEGLCAAVVRDRAPLRLRGNVRIRSRGGAEFDAKISLVPVPAGGEVAAIFVFTDISAEIEKERKIEFQAFHDPLTQLGNRALLTRDLTLEIERAERTQGRLAILCIDLDNFKNINDALGHAVGDILLQQLATRFRQTCRAPVWATRHGGDEFIVVMPALADPAQASALAEELMGAIAAPFLIEQHELRVTSSVGISIYPDHGAAIGELVSKADMAMYEAKREGRNSCRFHESGQLQRSTARLSMENSLRVAIAARELSLVFQPKVGLARDTELALEALLRWNSARLGSVSPATFIPVAEETGMIIEIGDWVLREALAAARRLRASYGRPVAIAVNVSPVQFRNEKLFELLEQLHADEGELPLLLEIELTESALAGDMAEVIAKLRRLKALGLKIAIDDFGTGYSSLAYLKHFPIDILKIDQAFIRDLHANVQDQSIVASVVQLGKSLGFELVAEGVEEASHVAILTALGCDYAQGYYFARPLPEGELPARLAALEARPH